MLYETTRLIVRQPELKDGGAIFEILSDSDVFKNNCYPMISREGIEAYMLQSAKEMHRFVMVLKTSGAVIGEINLERDSLRYGVDSIMFSYNMHPRYLHQGYMKEALQGAIDFCFKIKNAALVSGRVFADNEPSKRLLLSLGFTLEGTIRRAVRSGDGMVHDDCVFSLLREEYNVHSMKNHIE